jgi:hypothetical protein
VNIIIIIIVTISLVLKVHVANNYHVQIGPTIDHGNNITHIKVAMGQLKCSVSKSQKFDQTISSRHLNVRVEDSFADVIGPE